MNIQLARDSSFNDLLLDVYSFRPESNTVFEYYDGSSWVPLTTSGLSSSYYGNNVRVTVSDVEGGLKYWRVRLCVI